MPNSEVKVAQGCPGRFEPGRTAFPDRFFQSLNVKVRIGICHRQITLVRCLLRFRLRMQSNKLLLSFDCFSAEIPKKVFKSA